MLSKMSAELLSPGEACRHKEWQTASVLLQSPYSAAVPYSSTCMPLMHAALQHEDPASPTSPILAVPSRPSSTLCGFRLQEACKRHEACTSA